MILIILGITVALFIWGKLAPDIVALLSMLSLFLTGILDLPETLSGFSNPTVILIGALFVLGEALAQTGWTALAGQKLIQWSQGSKSRLMILLTFGSGVLSGFVSNTGTVATLLPVTISAAWNIGTLPSKLLIPVAFGSSAGGILTLTGTPTNLIVNQALEEEGLQAFSFFEIGLIGLPLLLITVLYFQYLGIRILPSYQTQNRPVNIESEMNRWIDTYNISQNYWRLRIRSSSPLIHTMIADWPFEEEYEVIITRLRRKQAKNVYSEPIFIDAPPPDTVFQASDIITVRCEPEAVHELMLKFNLSLQAIHSLEEAFEDQLISQELGITEVLVIPKSTFVGRKIKLGEYFDKFGIQFMGASRNNKALNGKEILVKAGDAYLIRGSWKNIEALNDLHEGLVVCGSPEGMMKNVPTLTYKSYISLAALLLMIGLMVFNIVPGAIAVLLAAGMVVLSGCLPSAKAYKGISWTSVIMIAGMIPMGTALQKTGIAQLVADGLVQYLGTIHPLLLLAGIFVLTSLFSQMINNSATAVLMAPIAILAAASLGISPKPFMAAVAVSASTAFLTPVGTPTNAMVMSAGGYQFFDYFKVGGPLLLFFLGASLLMIPWIWPF